VTGKKCFQRGGWGGKKPQRAFFGKDVIWKVPIIPNCKRWNCVLIVEYFGEGATIAISNRKKALSVIWVAEHWCVRHQSSDYDQKSAAYLKGT